MSGEHQQERTCTVELFRTPTPKVCGARIVRVAASRSGEYDGHGRYVWRCEAGHPAGAAKA